MDIILTTINFLQSNGVFLGVVLIYLEALIPMLPISVFITLNISSFGFIIGFILSWIASVFGSYTCYIISKKVAKCSLFKKLYDHNKKFKIWIKKIDSIPFSNLVVIISLPFAPSFIINISSGIAGIEEKKFLFSIMLGKVAIIFFWGFVGTSIIKSISDFNTIVIVFVMVIVAYFLSKFISEKSDIK